MLKRVVVFSVTVVILAFSGNTATASPVIWDNGPPDHITAEHIYSIFSAIDDFSLDPGTIIHDIHFTAVYYNNYEGGPFHWTFYEYDPELHFDVGDVIASGESVNVQITPLPGTDDDQFDVSFDLDNPVTWDGGIGWLELSMPDQVEQIWWMATTSQTGSYMRPVVDGRPQPSRTIDLSFQLTAIPEPSTLLLLGTGLLGVAGLARRRKSLRF